MISQSRGYLVSPVKVAACLLVLGMILAACGSSSTGAKSTTPNKELKIGIAEGFGTPLLGESATQTEIGAKLAATYVDTHGGLKNGAKFAFTTANVGETASQSSIAIKSLLSSGISAIIGPSITPQCTATGPTLDAAHAVAFTGCTTTSLFGAGRPYSSIYLAGADDAMNANGTAYEALKYYKNISQVDIFTYDYEEGINAANTVLKILDAKEGHKVAVLSDQKVPLTATDFSGYVSDMLSSTPVAGASHRLLLMETYGGADATFLSEARSAGLLSRFAAVMATDEYYLEATSFKGTAPKVWDAYGLCDYQAFHNSIMSWFASHQYAADHVYPNDWSLTGFDAVLEFAAAYNKSGSDTGPALAKALNGLKVQLPTGSSTLQDGIVHTDIGVCETVGNPSAPAGVQLIAGGGVPPSVTLKPIP